MRGNRVGRVLVTGANGFVGRAVVANLVTDGRDVRRAVRSPGRVDGALPHVAVGDVGADTDWRVALDGVDAIVHLAARVHVMHDTVAEPLAAFRSVNTEGTRNLAKQAAAAGVRRLVFVSSIKVSGEQTALGRPFNADDPPSPEGPYAQSKRETEIVLREVSAATALETVIIRPPLVYGPGVGANFLSMMRWLRRGVPLPLASVDNRRSLVFVDNLADLIRTCLDHPAARGQTFLASDDDDLSTPDLLRRLAVALDVRARLVPFPVSLLERGLHLVGRNAIFDRLCGSLQVDVGKTKRLLEWTPPSTVDAALLATARAFLAAPAR